MIWRLMKIDVAWRFVTRTVILFTVIAAIWHLFMQGIADLQEMPLLMFVAPLFSIGVTPFAQQNDAHFQAILPVTSRQVFAARMLSALALQWLPVVAAAILLSVLGDSGISAIVLRSWSIVTCIVLEIQCTGIRRLTMRFALPLIASQVLLFILNLTAVVQSWPVQDSAGYRIALLCCWGICAGVVARTWRTLPESSQLAPAKPSSASIEPLEADGARNRVAPWRPVLKTIFPLMGFEYLLYFLMMCFIYSPIVAYVLVVSGQNWKSIRSLFQWMLALPVPPRALLARVVLPHWLSFAFGYLAAVRLHLSFFPARAAELGIRTQLVTLAYLAGLSILASLAALAGDTHRVHRLLTSKHWPTTFSVLFQVAASFLIVWLMLATHRDPAEWLSAILPLSLGGAIGGCALALAALWWALEAVFRQVEFIGKPARGRS